jgi:hypothetical protein
LIDGWQLSFSCFSLCAASDGFSFNELDEFWAAEVDVVFAVK